ncbi:hypothetical protein JST99_01575 [Candidatus Dependentiae bacterium]|nr:hypothetical protein [Candidatus Dependentiae bacterium]
MKKILMIISFFTVFATSLNAQMRYNPINNRIYSHPETPDINQNEYRMLVLRCAQLEARMKLII